MPEVTTPPVSKRRYRHTYFVALLLIFLVLVVIGVIWFRAGSPIATIKFDGVINCIAFSPDGKVLAAGIDRGEFNSQPEGYIQLWDLSTYQQTASWVAHKNNIATLVFDSDGRTLTSTAIDRERNKTDSEVKTWDASTHNAVGDPKIIKSIPQSPVTSPDGSVIAKHGGGGWLVLTDNLGKELYRREADSLHLNCLAFSPDGKILATGGGDASGSGPSPIPGMNGDLRIWDVDTGRLLIKYNRHWFDPIKVVAFSPDGKHIASGSLDGTIKIWNVPVTNSNTTSPSQ